MNAEEEWTWMPEFVQEKKNRSVKSSFVLKQRMI